MSDVIVAPPIATEDVAEKKCALANQLDLPRIFKLLAPINNGLVGNEALFDNDLWLADRNVPQERKIDPALLSPEFTRPNGLRRMYVVNGTIPAFTDRGENRRFFDSATHADNSNQLSLQNVAHLLQSIVHYVSDQSNSDQKIRGIASRIFAGNTLNQEDASFLSDISQGNYKSLFAETPVFLHVQEATKKLTTILETLEPDLAAEVKKELPKLIDTLPGWVLRETTFPQENHPLEALHNWTIIRDVVEAFEKSYQQYENKPIEEFPGIELWEQKNTAPTALREFLNKWLDKLYEENDAPQNAPFQIQLVQPPVHFPNPPYADKESRFLQRPEDKFACDFFKRLFGIIEVYLNQPASKKITEAKEAEEGGGSDTTEITEELKKDEKDETKSDQHLNSLLETFSQAGVSYREESARLTNLLLPQFFQLHGLDLAQMDFQNGQDGALNSQYSAVRAEFGYELQNILLSLTPSEIANLSNASGRLHVMRRLYGRLTTSPRFMVTVNEYVKIHIEKRFEKITDPQARAKAKADYYGNVVLQNANVFDQALDTFTKDPKAQELFTNTSSLSDFAKLNGMSQGDFRYVFERLHFPSSDIPMVFTALESFVAERWSPERIRSLSFSSEGQFRAIFGFPIPADWLADPEGSEKYFRSFLDACTQYSYAYRQRAADLFGKDSILTSRDDGNLIRRQYLSGELSEAQLDELLKSREQAKGLKGGTLTLIGARASTRGDFDGYRSKGLKDIDIDELEKTYAQLELDRINSEKDFFNNLLKGEIFKQRLEDKISLLQAWGILAADFQGDLNDAAIQQQVMAEIEERNRGLSQYDSETGAVGRDGLGLKYSGSGDPANSPLGPGYSSRRSLSSTRKSPKDDVLESAASGLLKLGSLIPGVGAGFGALDQFLPEGSKKYVIGGAGLLAGQLLSQFIQGLVHLVSTAAGAIGGIIFGGTGILIGLAVGNPVLAAGLGVLGAGFGSQAFYNTFGGAASSGLGGFNLGLGGGGPSTQSTVAANSLNASTPVPAARPFIAPWLSATAAPTAIFGTAALTTYTFITQAAAMLPPPPPLTQANAGSVQTQKELSISKQSNPIDKVIAGQTITYTLTIRNNSDSDPMSKVTVGDTLDATHIDPNSVSIATPPEGVDCSASKGTSISCKLPDLTPKSQIVITYSGKANDTVSSDFTNLTAISNKASVSGYPGSPPQPFPIQDTTINGVNSPGSKIAQFSLQLVSGLQRGFWGDYNYHPDPRYATKYFDINLWHDYSPLTTPPCELGKCPDPPYPGPIQTDKNIALFWCTINVFLSYQNAGYPMPDMYGVGQMIAWFRSNGTLLGSVSDPPTVSQIKVGDAAFFGTDAYPNGDGHVAIVGVVTPNSITTYDSDNLSTTVTYSVDTSTGQVLPLGGVKLSAVGRIAN